MRLVLSARNFTKACVAVDVEVAAIANNALATLDAVHSLRLFIL